MLRLYTSNTLKYKCVGHVVFKIQTLSSKDSAEKQAKMITFTKKILPNKKDFSQILPIFAGRF